jgi:hypothetical protein
MFWLVFLGCVSVVVLQSSGTIAYVTWKWLDFDPSTALHLPRYYSFPMAHFFFPFLNHQDIL